MQAIVIATKTGTCLPVLCSSITFYVPEDVKIYLAGSKICLPRHETISLPNDCTNFGDSYNAAVKEAFKKHDHIIVANDDIVLTPASYRRLAEDLEILKKYKIGWLAAKSDYARGPQNIRIFRNRRGIRFEEEDQIIRTDIISPLFACIRKEAWSDFPPINWYSDDVQCLDIQAKGYIHFVSRSYVHHVGSQTIGMDHQKNHFESESWIKENRPELYKRWYVNSI